MKLEIGKPTSNSAPRDVFEINIEFMEGDADGYETTKILLAGTYKNLESDHPKMIELEMFINAINECVKRDSRGRGGFESSREFTQHYAANGNENLGLFCENVNYDYLDFDNDEDDMKTERPSIQFYCPSENYGGYYHSFESIEIFYYDEDGVQYKVETIN